MFIWQSEVHLDSIIRLPCSPMKKSRIVIVNRGKRKLSLFCERCSGPGTDRIEIKNRKVLRLFPGEYLLKAFYSNRSVVVESMVNGALHVEDVVSLSDSRIVGKQIVFSDAGKKFKIVCNEQYSIAGIVEGS